MLPFLQGPDDLELLLLSIASRDRNIAEVSTPSALLKLSDRSPTTFGAKSNGGIVSLPTAEGPPAWLTALSCCRRDENAEEVVIIASGSVGMPSSALRSA